MTTVDADTGVPDQGKLTIDGVEVEIVAEVPAQEAFRLAGSVETHADPAQAYDHRSSQDTNPEKYYIVSDGGKRLSVDKNALSEDDIKAFKSLASKGPGKGRISIASIVKQGDSLSRETTKNRRLTMLVVTLLGAIALLAGAVFASSVVAIELTKEISVKGGDSTLVDKETGNTLQTANSEVMVAKDGTLLSRQFCNNDKKDGTCVPKAGGVEIATTWVTLSDLPKQSLAFLDKLKHVTYKSGNNIKRKTVFGFSWTNSSYMTLELSSENAVSMSMFISGGAAWTAETPMSGGRPKIDLIIQNGAGRRLKEGPHANKVAFSFEDLVARFNGEISQPGVKGNWRRLSGQDLTINTDGLGDLAAWFGVLFNADGWAEGANAQANQALEANQCAFQPANMQQPQLGTTGIMRLTLKQEFSDTAPKNEANGQSVEFETGEYQLLYFNYQEGYEPAFKLAMRVTRSAQNVTQGGWPVWMTVTEGISSGTYDYELVHPKSDLHNYQNLPDGVQAMSDLEAAMAVLESSDFDTKKTTCNKRVSVDGAGMSADSVGLDPEMPVDCAREVLRWRAGGWTMETKEDGTIAGFAAADDQRFSVVSVAYPAGPVAFSGCPTGSERRLAAKEQGLSEAEAAPFSTRRLGFQEWMSGTNWCGAGTNSATTVCPSSSNSNDYTADRACRRHDHGAKSEAAGPAARMGCDADNDLVSATSNWAVQAAFGNWGLAAAWGCSDYGSYNCWNWKSKWWGGYWRYGGYCRGGNTRYGPGRHSGFSHNWGYVPWAKSCPNSNDMALRSKNCPLGTKNQDDGWGAVNVCK